MAGEALWEFAKVSSVPVVYTGFLHWFTIAPLTATPAEVVHV